jgi:hypothetical protein
VATLQDVRRIAMSLPRTSEHLIRDHTKFRVGALVYASVSADEERYHWVRARLGVLEVDELRELLIDAWCMVVPKKVAAAYLDSQGITRE